MKRRKPTTNVINYIAIRSLWQISISKHVTPTSFANRRATNMAHFTINSLYWNKWYIQPPQTRKLNVLEYKFVLPCNLIELLIWQPNNLWPTSIKWELNIGLVATLLQRKTKIKFNGFGPFGFKFLSTCGCEKWELFDFFYFEFFYLVMWRSRRLTCLIWGGENDFTSGEMMKEAALLAWTEFMGVTHCNSQKISCRRKYNLT